MPFGRENRQIEQCVEQFRIWRVLYFDDKWFKVQKNKPEMVNAPEGLNKVILSKMKRFDCKANQVSSKQLASS